MVKIWIALLVVGVALVVAASYKLCGIDKVESWLLWAVIQAEQQFGTGTGKLKLACVYDMFIARFPKLQAIIPYTLFARLVDKALVTMRDVLKNNKISDFVNRKC